VVIEVNGPMQLWQIGAHFGVTKQRIKQILIAALPKLKREFLNRGLTFDDFIQEGSRISGQSTYRRGADDHRGSNGRM
jgi:DNA-directed RNA polymerase sigma subunit (sigma70/sigma32)